MPINAHPEYMEAEKQFHNASTDQEKLKALEEMMRWMPKHKSAEALRKNIRTRYKKLKLDITKSKRKKGKQKGIKKAEMQVVLLGLTNSGKSSILKSLTNAQPKIASYGFTTTQPEIGTLNYQGCNIQIIDLPPIASPDFNKGIVNETNTILVVVEKLHEIKSILDSTKPQQKNKRIVFNKIDLYDNETKRKISETLKSKKYNFVLTSTFTKQGIEELKQKILNSFDIIRIYTKHQGKKQGLDKVPVILPPNSTLQDVAEKILHGYSKKVKHAKITGPSSKFSNQKVGLKHIVKDKDIIEFVTE